MAHWNYRVIEFKTPDGAWRAIHEVHYDAEGRPRAYSETPAVVLWDLEEGDESPKATIERMREALNKPALTVADFPNRGALPQTPHSP